MSVRAFFVGRVVVHSNTRPNLRCPMLLCLCVSQEIEFLKSPLTTRTLKSEEIQQRYSSLIKQYKEFVCAPGIFFVVSTGPSSFLSSVCLVVHSVFVNLRFSSAYLATNLLLDKCWPRKSWQGHGFHNCTK